MDLVADSRCLAGHLGLPAIEAGVGLVARYAKVSTTKAISLTDMYTYITTKAEWRYA